MSSLHTVVKAIFECFYQLGLVAILMGSGNWVRVLVTSSHRPSQRIRSFMKDLVGVSVFLKKVNRGKATFDDLAREMAGSGIRYLIIVNSYRGNPGSMSIYRLSELDNRLVKTAKIWIKGVRLSRESGNSECRFYRMAVDPSRCFKDPCFRLADILSEIFMARIDMGDRNNIDRIVVMDRGKQIYVKFIKGDGSECGPFIKISRVEFYS